MRVALALCSVLVAGCGSSVHRLPGEPVTPGGSAETPCESEGFLVVAKTRAEVTDEKSRRSHPRDGLGLYRVGSSDPESLTSIEGLDSPSLRKKRELAASHDTRQIIAASLGAVGLAAIAVGTVLFVNAFETRTTVDGTGNRTENNTVNGGRAALGGALVGVGFGFGIGGLVVNPGIAERTEVSAERHVFFDPPDDGASVGKLVQEHNARVKQACASP